MKMKVNDYTVNYSILEDGSCLPNSTEVLEQVGLSSVSDEIITFYKYLDFVHPDSVFEWVGNKAGINMVQAKERVTKYLLLDSGCRMCGGATEQVREEAFNCLKDNLFGLDLETRYSFEEVTEMLNEIGFNVTIG